MPSSAWRPPGCGEQLGYDESHYAERAARNIGSQHHSLALRDGPTMSAPQIATLNFQDEEELLDTAGAWGKVRDEQRNLVGWAPRRYLQPLAADGPRAVP